MNTNHTDPWEAEMSRAFDARVRTLHESPLTFDQVRGRAGRIRRNRRVAAAGGLVAAAAVLIPIGVLAGQGVQSSDRGPTLPADQPTQLTDPDESGFAYVEGRVLHLSDGSTVELPARYQGVHAWGDSLVGLSNDDDTGLDTLDILAEDGTVMETIDALEGVAFNADHTTLAYQTRDGDLVVRWDEGSTVIAGGLTDPVQLVAVAGGPDCDQNECRVYFQPNDGETPPQVAHSDGGIETVVPGVVGLEDVHESGLVSVQTRSNPDASACGGVFDTASGGLVYETCDSQVLDLSPTGRYVTGTTAYGSGVGSPYVTILDSRRDAELARFIPAEQGFVFSTVWEDDEHLLLTVREPAGWSIVRFGVDGGEERLLGPEPEGDEVSPAYQVVQGS